MDQGTHITYTVVGRQKGVFLHASTVFEHAQKDFRWWDELPFRRSMGTMRPQAVRKPLPHPSDAIQVTGPV